jgi:hypothetical protein
MRLKNPCVRLRFNFEMGFKCFFIPPPIFLLLPLQQRTELVLYRVFGGRSKAKCFPHGTGRAAISRDLSLCGAAGIMPSRAVRNSRRIICLAPVYKVWKLCKTSRLRGPRLWKT